MRWITWSSSSCNVIRICKEYSTSLHDTTQKRDKSKKYNELLIGKENREELEKINRGKIHNI